MTAWASRQERHRQKPQADGEPSLLRTAAGPVPVGGVDLKVVGDQPVPEADLVERFTRS